MLREGLFEDWAFCPFGLKPITWAIVLAMLD
jgi:hypothetical protein